MWPLAIQSLHHHGLISRTKSTISCTYQTRARSLCSHTIEFIWVSHLETTSESSNIWHLEHADRVSYWSCIEKCVVCRNVERDHISTEHVCTCLQATRWANNTRRSSPRIPTKWLCFFLPIRELYVLQTHSLARISRAAIELHGHFGGRRSLDVAERHFADLNARALSMYKPHIRLIYESCYYRKSLSLYLVRAIYVVRAIVLVDNDGILNVLHDRVLKIDARHKPAGGSAPCLDPEPVLCSREHHSLYGHVLHSLLLFLFS